MSDKNFQENNFSKSHERRNAKKKEKVSLSLTTPPSKDDFYRQLKNLEIFHEKIIHILKQNEVDESLIEILARFFTLKDEVLNNHTPSKRMLEYHSVLTHEIYKSLQTGLTENIFGQLLILFLKHDFNKHTICTYYAEQLKILIAENHQLEVAFFQIADLIHRNYIIHHFYSVTHPSLFETIVDACTTRLNLD